MKTFTRTPCISSMTSYKQQVSKNAITKRHYEVIIKRKINRTLTAADNSKEELVYWIPAYDIQEATFSAMNDFRDEFYPDIIMEVKSKEL